MEPEPITEQEGHIIDRARRELAGAPVASHCRYVFNTHADALAASLGYRCAAPDSAVRALCFNGWLCEGGAWKLDTGRVCVNLVCANCGGPLFVHLSRTRQ